MRPKELLEKALVAYDATFPDGTLYDKVNLVLSATVSYAAQVAKHGDYASALEMVEIGDAVSKALMSEMVGKMTPDTRDQVADLMSGFNDNFITQNNDPVVRPAGGLTDDDFKELGIEPPERQVEAPADVEVVSPDEDGGPKPIFSVVYLGIPMTCQCCGKPPTTVMAAARVNGDIDMIFGCKDFIAMRDPEDFGGDTSMMFDFDVLRNQE